MDVLINVIKTDPQVSISFKHFVKSNTEWINKREGDNSFEENELYKRL